MKISKELATPPVRTAIEELLRKVVEECRADGLDVKAVGVASAVYIPQDRGMIADTPNIAFRISPAYLLRWR